MVLRCGHRFVYLLHCHDDTDYYTFKLRMRNSGQFSETWRDDERLMCGVTIRGVEMTIVCHDPQQDFDDICFPLSHDPAKYYIYITIFESTQACGPKTLERRMKKALEIEQDLIRLYPHRSPELIFEPYWQ